MQKKLLHLYPQPGEKAAINGLYLAHQVHKLGTTKSPFVYANFLSSLDGRIALEDTSQSTTYIPKHLTTASTSGYLWNCMRRQTALLRMVVICGLWAKVAWATFYKSGTKILLNGVVTMI